jgi:hypothetical protein
MEARENHLIDAQWPLLAVFRPLRHKVEAWLELLSYGAVRDLWCGRLNMQSGEFSAEMNRLLGDAGCK